VLIAHAAEARTFASPSRSARRSKNGTGFSRGICQRLDSGDAHGWQCFRRGEELAEHIGDGGEFKSSEAVENLRRDFTRGFLAKRPD
jgi:hypothetical protein